MTSRTADLLLLGVAIVWGSTFVVVKVALAEMGPLTLVFWRFLVAAGLLALWRYRRPWVPSLMELRAAIILGLPLAAGYILQTLALQQVSASKSGFLTGLYIPIVALLSYPILREKMAAFQAFGIVIATAGLALLSLAPEDLSIATGDLWLIACAFAFAVQVLAVSYFHKSRFDPVRIGVLQLLVVSTFTAPFMWFYEDPLPALSFSGIAAFALLTFLATALAFWIQLIAQPRTSAARASLVMGLESPFAALFGVIFLGEMLSLRQWTGCVAIGLGAVMVEYFRKER